MSKKGGGLDPLKIPLPSSFQGQRLIKSEGSEDGTAKVSQVTPAC